MRAELQQAREVPLGAAPISRSRIAVPPSRRSRRRRGPSSARNPAARCAAASASRLHSAMSVSSVVVMAPL